jgi:hypothetical protein
MGRFLAFLFVFVLGALLGAVGGASLGGVVGVVGGAVVGACAVVDKAVGSGTLTQDEANTVVRAVASEDQRGQQAGHRRSDEAVERAADAVRHGD